MAGSASPTGCSGRAPTSTTSCGRGCAPSRRRIEARVDEEAPADDLVFEAWLHKVTIEAVVEHYRLIADRADALAAEVAEEFAALDRHAAFEAPAPRARPSCSAPCTSSGSSG